MSAMVSALLRLPACPQASSSVSVPGISSVSQLSNPSGFVLLGVSPVPWCGTPPRGCRPNLQLEGFCRQRDLVPDQDGHEPESRRAWLLWAGLGLYCGWVRPASLAWLLLLLLHRCLLCLGALWPQRLVCFRGAPRLSIYIASPFASLDASCHPFIGCFGFEQEVQPPACGKLFFGPVASLSSAMLPRPVSAAVAGKVLPA